VTVGRWLTLALLVAVLPVSGAGAGSHITRERLPNGFTVLVRENPVAPVAAVTLMVRMGGRWEPAEHMGISNFLHAVMVKGTTRRSGAELAEAVADMGGKLSAAGEADFSLINATALARFWKELLALTTELALEPALPPADVGPERDWLVSRIQRQRDSPSARAFDEFYALVYGAHPYGRPGLGTPESLARIDHAALAAHYRASYRPERMVLAVSGQVKTDEVLAEARRLFGGLPGGGTVAEPGNPRPSPTSRRQVVEQPAQQTQILAGALAPALDHPDHAPVKVLASVLGGGMAGRLFAELRDKQALAYTASAFYEPVREPGIFVLYLGTAPDNAERAEAALLKEIDRVRNELVAADDLGRAKGYLLGSYTMDRRTNARLAWSMAFHEVQAVGQDFPDRYRRAVEAVTADDVRRVARTYLGAPSILVLRPPGAR
jgi:predicted Zn-dependent peptidase